LFCVPKAAVLHGKSVGFASQKNRFRNVKAQLSLFNGIIFTKLNGKTPTISLVDKSSLVGKRISIGGLLNLLSYIRLT